MEKTGAEQPVFGIEQEWAVEVNGFTALSHDPIKTSQILRFVPAVVPAYGDPNTSGIWTANGMRVYKDMGFIEISTPEMTGLDDLPRYIFASEDILYKTLEKAVAKDAIKSFSIHRRVIDDARNTQGYHENYLARRDKIPEVTAQYLGLLAAHLATRGIFTGAGYLLPFENKNKHQFLVSQKTSQLENDFTDVTTSNKPLISQRDEPHMSEDLAELHRRIHVTSMDRVFSPWAMKLGVGTTSLLIRAIEQGAKNDKIFPDENQAHKVARCVAEDYTLTRGFTLGAYENITAIDVQYEILKLLANHVEKFGDKKDDFWVLTNLEKALTDVRSETGEIRLAKLQNRVDWITRKRFIEYQTRDSVIALMQGGANEKKRMAYEINRQFDLVSPHPKSINGLLRRSLAKEFAPTSEEIESAVKEAPDTRARIRGKLVIEAAKRAEKLKNCNFDWSEITYENIGATKRHRIILPDPRRPIMRLG